MPMWKRIVYGIVCIIIGILLAIAIELNFPSLKAIRIGLLFCLLGGAGLAYFLVIKK